MKTHLYDGVRSLPLDVELYQHADSLPQGTVWVATIEAETNGLKGQRTIAIVMNASSVEEATEIDYLITNESEKKVTKEWIVKTFSNRNYIEKFYREAKGWLGLKEYQVRKKEALIRHFILVFTAYTFIIYQQLMGGLRKRYAHKSLTTFAETLEAFLTEISYNFLVWLQNNEEVLYIAIDRTRWGLINLLMVSLVINNRAIPIYFELLDHVGNSDLETQTAILARVLPVLKGYTKVILGVGVAKYVSRVTEKGRKV